MLQCGIFAACDLFIIESIDTKMAERYTILS